MFVGMGANSSGGYNITDSLRFRASAGAYLNWTPASAGNRRTWTWSAWVKRGSLSGYQNLFFGSTGDYNSGDVVSFLRIDDDGALTYFDVTASVANNFYYNVSSKKLRDPSAWYHIMVSIDTTQATASDRFKLYVNNEQVTSFTGGTVDPSLNYQTGVNSSTGNHRIGYYRSTYPYYFDGYMTEVNFVDGQALDPSSFGETNADGVWSPKKYTGTYGTNGFYLPMKETTQATGFNTVLYAGNDTTQSITGVGFSPDLVWIKARNTGTLSHGLFDSVRGVNKTLVTDGTYSEFTNTVFTSFDSDGFTVTDSGGNWTNDSYNYVAWCWDAGSSTVSNTDGTITSSVRANPATGFSIATFNAAASGAFTVGHGLGTAPKVVITRYRNIASDWYTYHESIGNTKYLKLNDSIAETTSSTIWDNTSPTSDVFTLGSSIAGSSSWTMVAYCFSEVSGYSKFGSYTGTGSSGNSVTGLGFKPAFLMYKRTDSTGSWVMVDNTRSPDNSPGEYFIAESTNAENVTTLVDFDDDGFTVNSTSGSSNASGGTYIYMAFADTRDFQWNFDASGNKNNWTPNNINSNASSETTYDLMSDTPSLANEDTANFCTLNPLDKGTGNLTVSDANLKASVQNYTVFGTMGVSSGKYYWELTMDTSVTYLTVGIGSASLSNNVYMYNQSPAVSYYAFDGTKFVNGTNTAYGATFTTGDVIGIALDADNDQVTFYKNNTSQGTITGLTSGVTWMPTISTGSTTYTESCIANFGQRPFAYTPPTGYKKLNTYNLPDSSITDGSQYFITNTFTGTGSTLSINTGFSPDFVWLKSRSFADHPLIYDSIRGANQRLYSSLTNAESTATNQLNSFDSDGYTLGSDPSGQINVSGQTSVGWSWRGSDSTAVSNTDGTITSTVSANTTSGFSVATWTGTGVNATIGHGLGVAPSVMIIKCRTLGTQHWAVYHQSLGNTQFVLLNLTNSAATLSNLWNNTSPTSNVFSVGNNTSVNQSGQDYVGYMFAEVEGFSKFGSYTGNGSADGPLIYTGFRPAFVMVKNTSTAATNWCIHDTSRKTYNISDSMLLPNDSSAELVNSAYGIDILSNGFKIKNSNSNFNTSGNNYIYMAFAENPFKNSLAR